MPLLTNGLLRLHLQCTITFSTLIWQWVCVCFVCMCMWNASFHIADQSTVVTVLYCWSQMVWVWAVGYINCCVCVCVLFSVVNSLSAVLTVLCVIMALSLIVNAPPLCSGKHTTHTHTHTQTRVTSTLKSLISICGECSITLMPLKCYNSAGLLRHALI